MKYMKYEYQIIEIDDLGIGDTIDIPEGSLILSESTVSEQGYIHVANKADWKTRIKILVPIKEKS